MCVPRFGFRFSGFGYATPGLEIARGQKKKTEKKKKTEPSRADLKKIQSASKKERRKRFHPAVFVFFSTYVPAERSISKKGQTMSVD